MVFTIVTAVSGVSLHGCRQLLISGGRGLASKIELVAGNESRSHIFRH